MNSEIAMEVGCRYLHDGMMFGKIHTLNIQKCLWNNAGELDKNKGLPAYLQCFVGREMSVISNRK